MKDRREAKKNGKNAVKAKVAKASEAVMKDADTPLAGSGAQNRQLTISDIFGKVPAEPKKDEE